MDRNVLKYSMPPQIIQYLKSKGNSNSDDLMRYLLHIHFPWMPLSLHDDNHSYIFLYQQGYLATIGKADSLYQSIYDSYIEPILMNKIGNYFWLKQQGDYLSLYKYIKERPHLVQDVMNNNFNADITLQAIEYNASMSDDDYRGNDEYVSQEEIDLFPPIPTIKHIQTDY
jgi:hypothetical protein